MTDVRVAGQDTKTLVQPSPSIRVAGQSVKVLVSLRAASPIEVAAQSTKVLRRIPPPGLRGWGVTVTPG